MFITALSQLEGIDSSNYDVSPFSDVDIDTWYGAPIAWAMSDGIICSGILSGGVQGTFRPNENITREEMAVIIANFLENRDFPLVELNVPQFNDSEEASTWARNSIHAMRRHSIISGIGNNRYNPQGHATRAEVAQIFANLVRAMVGLS
jgi:hypothetical protein